MPVKKIPVKITRKKSGRGYITHLIHLPKEVVEKLGLDKMDYMIMEVDYEKKTITLKPLE